MTSSADRRKHLNTAAHTGFVLVGVVNTFLGPMLPVLSLQWGLNDAQAGRLFAAQYAGGIAGALLSSMALRRFGYPRTLLAGYALMSAGMAALGFSGALTAIAAILAMGVSLGLIIPTTNVLVSELHPARRAAALNLVNFLWGVGAIAGPPAMVYLSRGGILRPMLMMSMMLASVTAWLSRCTFSPPDETGADTKDESLSALQAWMTPFALGTGLLIFLYVGAESSTYGWVATYAKRLASPTQTFWMLAQTVFWIGLLGSRACAPLILRRHSASALIMAGMLAANAGLLIALMSRQLAGAVFGSALAGFGMGPVFPTVFARFTQRFGVLAARMAGFAFVIANLGAGSFPWAVGLVSTHYGGLRTGLMVPVLGAGLMAVLQVAMMRPGTDARASYERL